MYINPHDGISHVVLFPNASGSTYWAVNYDATNTRCNDFLHIFDVWQSPGKFKVSNDGKHQEVWFEVSRAFVEMCRGTLEDAEMLNAFRRLGAELIIEESR